MKLVCCFGYAIQNKALDTMQYFFFQKIHGVNFKRIDKSLWRAGRYYTRKKANYIYI